MDKKRIIFLIIFIIATIVIGYLLYRVFFAPEKKAPVAERPGIGTPGEFPAAATGREERPAVKEPRTLPSALPSARIPAPTEEAKPRITQVIDNSIKNPQADKAGRVRFYNNIDGKFYRLNKDGTTEVLSDQTFYRVDTVTWSPTKDEAVLEYPDGANIYYNFATKKQVTLPKHWEEFSFSSLGDKIASKSIGLAPENRWLITASPEGNDIELIEPMGNNADKVTVDWSPNKQIVALSLTGEPQGANRQEVLFVGLHGENFKSTIVEGRGIISQWSPSGKRLLYSVYNARNDYKPELWIENAEGDEIGTGRKILNINTWADKCAFADERFVYCAAPNSLKRGAGFAPQTADDTADTIYRIDTETGLRAPIETDESRTIKSMFLSDDGRNLYFTDKKQEGLFQLAL
ncbi:MAG: hypothetical protein WC862_00370 [Patescibacteria group bacterium]